MVIINKKILIKFKILIYILLLFIYLQSLTKADDIRDFQIEGMSVGESLLDFFSKSEIDNLKKGFYPSSKKFNIIVLPINNSKIYDNIIASLKTNDEKYIIHSISGAIETYRNTKKCLQKQLEIKKDIISIFPEIKYKDYTFDYPQDTIGKSVATVTDFEFISGGEIRVFCNDWSEEREKERNSMDNVQIAINTSEKMEFIQMEAYK